MRCFWSSPCSLSLAYVGGICKENIRQSYHTASIQHPSLLSSLLTTSPPPSIFPILPLDLPASISDFLSCSRQLSLHLPSSSSCPDWLELVPSRCHDIVTGVPLRRQDLVGWKGCWAMVLRKARGTRESSDHASNVGPCETKCWPCPDTYQTCSDTYVLCCLLTFFAKDK